MAILRQLNEFTRESVCIALEPSRECVASCSYCFARLNSSHQNRSRSKSLKDDSSFERTLERAYGPNYDPTNFLQWALHNRLVIGYSNTVEPFQDIQQGISILSLCDKFSLPLFVQTKGINFDYIKDYLKPFSDNSSIFVSLPTLDQRVVKRFEPGTPPIAERLKMIEWLADNDFWVIGALSPYHESWCEDPSKLINTLSDHGVNSIFVDRLHLNSRQHKIAPDRVMAELAGGRGKAWPPRAMEHARIIYHESLANDLEFYANGFEFECYGYSNTLPVISPDYAFSRGTPWPYHDGGLFHILSSVFYSEDDDIRPIERDFNDSILFRWSDILRIMHGDRPPIDQPFSYSSLMDIIPIYKKIPDQWKRAIGVTKPQDVATMPEWFRCLYNNPYKHQFVHRHPFIRCACNMDGVPFLDDDGNLICLYDPDYSPTYNRHFRKVESLEPFRRLNFGME